MSVVEISTIDELSELSFQNLKKSN